MKDWLLRGLTQEDTAPCLNPAAPEPLATTAACVANACPDIAAGSRHCELGERFELPAVEQILDELPDGAYITDCDRRIVFWNRAAERITGWNREDVLGRHCRDNILVHVDKDGRLLCGKDLCPLHRSIVTGNASKTPLVIFAKRKDGTRVPVEASVAPLRDLKGKVVGGIEVFRDLSSTIDDLKRAQLIQRNTLKSKLAKDPRLVIATHYIPCDSIGGDFFRIEALDAHRYAVLIADVTGHGVSAALHAMQIRALWEEERLELGEPERFMSALGSRLYTLSRPNDCFATGVHVVIDANTGLGRYVRAGHERPLILRADGSVTLLEERGLGLGLLPHATYEPGVFQLQPGDGLLLYTDGAVEVVDAAERELGSDGLIRLLQSGLPRDTRFLPALEKALLDYSRAIRLEDDLTFVWIQRPASGHP